MPLALIDATSDSLTVSWSEVPGTERYVLQVRKAIDSDTAEFETLSDKLTSTQARKRNLADENGTGFFFRAGAVKSGNDTPATWIAHTEPFRLLTEAEQSQRMAAPNVTLGGASAALTISWQSHTPESLYELQMRESTGGSEWSTIAAALKGTEVRKKNLTASNGYQFRVRPVSETTQIPFSPPSDSSVALGLSQGMQRLFNSLEDGTLLRKVNEPPIPLADALGGKEFVLLYASAHWCGPCRQFTPKLTNWYHSLGRNSTVEVIFLSADHDEAGFRSYFDSMPWLAVDYDDDAREQLMAHIRVSGIPRLAVLDGRTGRIIEDNAVGKSLDVNRWRNLAAKTS
jgi:thiol-disulfide isomerase/thioredoxin